MKSVQLLLQSNRFHTNENVRGDVKHVNNLRFFRCQVQKEAQHIHTKNTDRELLCGGDRFVYAMRIEKGEAERMKGIGALSGVLSSAFFAFSRLICWFYRLNMKRTELFRFSL